MARTEAIPLPDGEEDQHTAAELAHLKSLHFDESEFDDSRPAHVSRSINLRFLLVLFLVCVVGTVMIVKVHSHQLSLMTDVVLAEAQQSAAVGELDEAQAGFLAYLRLVPDDWETRWQLAQVSEQLADTPRKRVKLFLLLEEIVRNAPANSDARRMLVDVTLDGALYSHAITHLQELVESYPDDTKLLMLLAQSYEGNADAEEAAATYRAVIRKVPLEYSASMRLASILRTMLDEKQQADEVMDRMVAASNGHFRAYLTRGQYHLRNGQVKLAILDSERAYELAPEDSDVLVLAANLIARQSHLVEAGLTNDGLNVHRGLEDLLKRQSDNLVVIGALSRLELAAGNTDAAIQLLQDGLRIDADNIAFRWRLADTLISQQEIDVARSHIAQLRERGATKVYVEYLLGRVHAANGQWLDASRVFESARVQSENLGELPVLIDLHLARCYHELGNTNGEIAAYRAALGQNSELLDAKVGLAAALVQVGRLEDALAYYRQAMDVPGVPIRVAQILRTLVGQRPFRERDWSEIGQTLDLAAKADANLPDIVLIRAGVLLDQNKLKEARELIQRAIERDPTEIKFPIALFEMLLLSGQQQQARKVISDAGQRLGDRPELYLAQIQALAIEPGDKSGLRLRQLISERDRFTEEIQEALLPQLALACELGNVGEAAAELWHELAKRRPEQMTAWWHLARLAMRQSDDSRCQEYIGRIREIEGVDGAYWRLAEASRLTNLARGGGRQHLDRASELLSEVAAESPVGLPRLVIARAEVAELQGDYASAIDFLKLAIDSGDRDLRVLSKLVSLLQQRERFVEANRAIRKYQAMGNSPLFGRIGRQAIDVSIQANDRAHAIEVAQRAVANTPGDYRNRLWLAQVLWAAGRNEDAGEAFKEAVDKTPEVGGTWVALVAFLAWSGRQDEAAARIEEAKAKLSDSVAPPALAQCYEAIGQLKLAEENYRLAHANDSKSVDSIWKLADFYLRHGDLQQADALLRELMSPEMQTPASIRRAARRGSARALAVRGNFLALQQAIQLVDYNLKQNQDDAKDLRLKARLLSSRPIRKFRMQSIRLYERLANQGNLDLDDSFQLAQLQLLVGRWSDARLTMLSLIARDDKQPDYAAFGVHTLLEHGEVGATCESWLGTLAQLQPHAFRTVQLQARYHIEEKEFERAIEVLMAWGNQPVDKPANGDKPAEDVYNKRQILVAVTLSDFARRLDKLGRLKDAAKFSKEAEALLRRHIVTRPHDTHLLLRFLVQQGRIEEAIELCPQAWKSSSSPIVVARACVELLRHPRAKRVYFQQVKAWIENTSNAKPNVELRLQLANVLHLEGRYAEAQALYAQVIEESPRAVLALNDLALLICLQGGDAIQALQFVQRAIDQAGPLDFLLDTRATVYLALGQFDSAVSDLEDAIADSASPVKYYHLAQAKLALGKKEEARTAFDEGIAIRLQAGALHPLEQSSFQRLKLDLQIQ